MPCLWSSSFYGMNRFFEMSKTSIIRMNTDKMPSLLLCSVLLLTCCKYDAVALLVEKGIDVNHRDKFGRTPLYMACRSGVLPDIEKLLKSGANPNVQESKYGHAPIHVAAIKLAGKYLDGWTKGIDGTKAIENFKSIFKLLMENGAKLDLKDKQGRDVEALLKRFTPFKLKNLKTEMTTQ